MSSLSRVYIEKESLSGGTAEITGDTARHLSKVMRIRVGENILVCDKQGGEYIASVTSVGDNAVTAVLGEYRVLETEPKCPIVLYQCMPKSDKMDTVVQKAVELGATEIIPVFSERCIARPEGKSLCNKLERWRKIAESAAAQCGRGIIPYVADAITYSEACRQMDEGLKFICYEGENTLPLAEAVEKKEYKCVSFLIGPEGGLTDSEVAAAASFGIPAIGLGKRILRTETASGYVLAALDILL